jgi:hypothetical protein
MLSIVESHTQRREIPAHACLDVGEDLGGGPSERKSGDGEWLLDPVGIEQALPAA